MPSVPIFIGWVEAGAFWAYFLRKSLGPLSERHGPVRGVVRGKRGGLGGRSPPKSKILDPPSESWVPWRHLFRRAIRKPPRKIGTLGMPACVCGQAGTGGDPCDDTRRRVGHRAKATCECLNGGKNRWGRGIKYGEMRHKGTPGSMLFGAVSNTPSCGSQGTSPPT